MSAIPKTTDGHRDIIFMRGKEGKLMLVRYGTLWKQLDLTAGTDTAYEMRRWPVCAHASLTLDSSEFCYQPVL